MLNLNGHTKQLKLDIQEAMTEKSQLERREALYSQILDAAGIPKLDGDTVYDLLSRIEICAQYALIALASDGRTQAGRELVNEVQKLRDQVRVLEDEVAYLRGM